MIRLSYQNFKLNTKGKYYFILKKMISDENKRIIKGTEHTITTNIKIGGEFSVSKNASFLDKRETKFMELFEKQKQYLQNLPREKITVTLPDGKKVEGTAFDSTPLSIAKTSVKKSLIPDFIVAKVTIKS